MNDDWRRELRSYLDRAGVSQQEFAIKIGCSQSHLSRLLTGDQAKFPSTALRARILRETGIAIIRSEERELIAFERPGEAA